MKTVIGTVLLAVAVLTGIPGILLMRAARWCGDRSRELTRPSSVC